MGLYLNCSFWFNPKIKMILDHIILILLPILFLCIFSQTSASSSQCPIDLNYVLTIPWDSSSCQNKITNTNPHTITNCCQTLTSLYGVGLARYLKQTSLFRLPNTQTSIACLSDFQAKLSRLNLPTNLTSSCFEPQQFVNTTNTCADIQTKQDWLSVLGHDELYTSLDMACKEDLSDLTACDACVLAGFKVQARLLGIDGDSSHSRGCFYYTVLYLAGLVNEHGPDSVGSLSCIFGLPLTLPASGPNRALISGSVTAGIAVVAVACLIGFQFTKGQRGLEEYSDSEDNNGLLNWRPKADSIWFDILDLERATGRFSDKNLIGQGQFGVVYKGKLQDGAMIAVKKVIDSDFQGDAEFAKEIEIISTLKHRNLVPLRGCCVSERNKYLVYDYIPNGNLSDHLFPLENKAPMSWPQRKSIILDIANALAYLHHGVKPPIYHRDIKPTNILVDSCMRARVADFGLAKQGKEGGGESNLTTRIAGTHGYLAPEYALYGQLTERSDVYSFGIVVLEIMCGRRALDLSSSMLLITDWAWSWVKDGKVEQVLDPWLLGSGDGCGMERRYPKMVMERFLMVGILCAHLMVALRPTIADAIRMLEGDIEVPHVPDRPLYLISAHEIRRTQFS